MPDLKAYPQNASELQIVSDVLGIIVGNFATTNIGKKGKAATIAPAVAVTSGDVNELIMTYPDGVKYKISVYATQLNKSAGLL